MPIPLLKYAIDKDVVAFTTTREGGVSEGNYGCFNLNPYCGDSPAHVKENKDRLCAQLNIEEERLILPHQVHNDASLIIDEPFFALSSQQRAAALEGVDALITRQRQTCIGVSTADCVPILLFDQKQRVAAAVHAGWRGTVKKIVSKTLETLFSSFQTRAEDLKVVIGPSISQPVFQVGPEVYDAFCEAGFPMQDFAYPQQDKWYIDLWGTNHYLLDKAGVPLENIQVAGICTYQNHEEYFSAHRLGIDSGRLFTGILLL